MATTRSVDTGWYTDERLRPLSDAAKLVWVVLICFEGGDWTGIFRCSKLQLQDALGHSTVATATRALAELSDAGLICVDHAVDLVWIRAMYAKQTRGKHSERQRIGTEKHLAMLPRSPLVQEFVSHYISLGYEFSDTLSHTLSQSLSYSHANGLRLKLKLSSEIEKEKPKQQIDRAKVADAFAAAKSKLTGKSTTCDPDAKYVRDACRAVAKFGATTDEFVRNIWRQARSLQGNNNKANWHHLNLEFFTRPGNWNRVSTWDHLDERQVDIPAVIDDIDDAEEYVRVHGSIPNGWELQDSGSLVKLGYHR